MQPEEQQRIMGYFIEEAKDHLNTIEQGLLSLQATIEDSEKANEIFRAAHSVKGGAAMLGLESIQKTAHRMEDYFKILKESPVQVDRVLETMFLRISDGLKDLLEHLEGPFGLTQDKAQEIMADVEPVFGQIETHLSTLVGQTDEKLDVAPKLASGSSPEAVKARFKRDGASFLRKMLAAFKQSDNTDSRKAIQDICTQLYEMGEQFELSAWCDLIKTAKLAAASSDNDYRALAPVLIKEIKQAQDFVLAGRASEISVSDAMQALLPEDILEEDAIANNLAGIDDFDLESSLEDSLHGLDFASDEDLGNSTSEDDASPLFGSDEESLETALEESSKGDLSEIDFNSSETEDELGDLFGNSELNDPSSGELSSSSSSELMADTHEQDGIERLSLDLDFNEIPSELSALDRSADSQEKADESLDALLATVNVTGPEVGEEELNSLADLFDGDLDELDNTLGGHAFATDEMQLHPEKIDISPEDDLNDLLSSDTAEEIEIGITDEEIDDDLFGGTLTDGEFAITDDTDFDELDQLSGDNQSSAANDLSDDFVDLSKDPWEDEGTSEDSAFQQLDTPDSQDDIFGVDLDVEMANLELFEETKNTETPAPEINTEALELAELEGLPPEDLLEEDLLIEDLLTEDLLEENLIENSSTGLDEEGSMEAQKVAAKAPKFQSSHTVSPKEDDIEFPTLTGEKLQEAEEDIDSFFFDEDENDASEEQLADSPWGELSAEPESSEVDELEDAEGLFNENALDNPEKQEEDSFSIDLIDEGLETDTERETNTDTEDLEAAFLDIEPSAAFDIDLDVDQAGAELNELLEDGEDDTTSDTSTDSAANDLWDELVSEPADSDWDKNNTELDLETVLSSDDAEAKSFISTEEDSDDLSAADLAELDNGPVESDRLESLQIDSEQVLSEIDPHLASALTIDNNELEGKNQEENLTEVQLSTETPPSKEIASENFALEDLAFDSLDTTAAPEPNEEKTEQASSDEFDFTDFDFEVSDIEASEQLEEPEDKNVSFEKTIPESTSQVLALDHSQPEDEITDLTVEPLDETSLENQEATENVSKDISGDELSEEILADFETAFGTGILDQVSSEERIDSGLDDKPTTANTLDDADTNALDISELEIDGRLDEGLDVELDGFLTEDELAEIDDSLPDLENYAEDISTDATDATTDSEVKGVASSLNASEAEVPTTNDFEHGFDELDDLLSEDPSESDIENANDLPTFVGDQPANSESADEDFGDLERLLEDGPAERSTSASQRRAPQAAARRSSMREQTMRVSVSHLDTLSNLVGELVVSRNTLERDQERLRQFLDNLLFQVQQLNDVGQRMRDLYERSLLESSLMSNRHTHQSASTNTTPPSDDPTSFFEDHATGETFDALEMDRFTGFHTLSQEMIELIVRVRESSSDIGYTVESSDQVTRQFRQITTQLQEGLNTARMVAFSQAADRLPRAVRDISLKCGKEARLMVEGQDTLIDKMIVEHLYDPLTHLVNNAITHGIETPEVRQAKGKSSEGSITVRAFYQGNQTVIYVADDGGGINTDFVKQKAIEKKLITQNEAADLSDIETYDLLFHPGFSTRDQADDFAGRGVGMDVVRTSLAEIRGSITIDSELEKGTSFTIRLPLTLSISKALSCVSNQARIAFPMDGVEDMLDVPRDRIVKNEKGQDCVRWRDTLLTFQPVTELLKFNRTLGRGRVYGGNQEDDILSIIVLRSANTYIAVQVDQVIGEQEIVIKQLEGPVPKPLGIAGATVLGDGRVMPIADVLELIDIAMGRVRREPSSMLWSQEEQTTEEETPVKQDPTVLIVDDSITVRELLSMSFNKVGYRVEQARDGQEAWDKLRSGLPCDLVFCDIEMPRMDGLELLSRMQKDNHLKSIPIAMLTSRGADRHRQMAVDLGASGYFTKPYLEEALLDAAQRMLNGETLAKGRGG
ncbi:MAG: response regulator [Phormidesmis sp.]